jgi:hypothetical protein
MLRWIQAQRSLCGMVMSLWGGSHDDAGSLPIKAVGPNRIRIRVRPPNLTMKASALQLGTVKSRILEVRGSQACALELRSG